MLLPGDRGNMHLSSYNIHMKLNNVPREAFADWRGCMA